MGPDLTDVPRTTACPSCGAALRPDAPWCTLCYTDVRPKSAPIPDPPPVVPVHAAYGIPAGDPLTQPLQDLLPPVPSAVPASAVPTAAAPLPGAVQRTWPCSVCEAVNPISSDTCSVCLQPFLAAMKVAEKPVLVLPLVGDLGAMSRGGRAGVALGLVALVLVPLALITLLLTGRPPKAPASPPASNPPGASQSAIPGAGTVTNSSVGVQ